MPFLAIPWVLSAIGVTGVGGYLFGATSDLAKTAKYVVIAGGAYYVYKKVKK